MAKELPRGLRLDHGYLQVRIQHDGITYCRNFGPDSDTARSLAVIHLSEKRKEILMGKFGYAPDLPSKSFKEAANIYFEFWAREIDAEGRPRHNVASCHGVRRILNVVLIPFFGKMAYEAIRPRNIQEWRDKRVSEVLGTSANREQVILSSMFSHIEAWVKSEKIKAFKLPEGNPASSHLVEHAKMRRRERVLTTSELSLLKASCQSLNDPDMWEICKMALKSLLRKKDLMRLEAGLGIDMEQAKTGLRVQIPIQVLKPLNYVNFRKRWEKVQRAAQLPVFQFRDLRKTGANLLKLHNHSSKLISEFLGHGSTRTTELYMVPNAEHLKPLASELSEIVDKL